MLMQVKRLLNPRYSWLAPAVRASIRTVLDIGGTEIDCQLAARYLPGCHYTAVNIIKPVATPPGVEFLQTDLDREGLSVLQGRRFDYVICSHTLEHLVRGKELLTEMGDLVGDGGYLYVEWPSERSQRFPLLGVGLNFHDDPTHVTSLSLQDAVTSLQESGFCILSAGPRRNRLRQWLAPLLLFHSWIKHGRFVLYDFWDWTGYADHVCAKRLNKGSTGGQQN